MPIEPVDHQAEVLFSYQRVFRSEYSMTRPRQPHELNFFAVALECHKKLFGLFDWDAGVVFSVEQQHRCVHVSGVGKRGMFPVAFELNLSV